MKEDQAVGRYTRISASGVPGTSPELTIDRNQRAGSAPKAGWPDSRGACAAIALASALLVGSMGAAIAQSPPAPAPNKAWGGCTLDADAVAALESRINAGGQFDDSLDGPFKVSFVLVYALDNDNDGQPLEPANVEDPLEFTGAILCTNDVAGDPGEVDIVTTTETTTISNVDLLDAEQTFVLQYEGAGGIQKRVCHKTDSSTDCFRIFSPSD
jgi:hypothetical protein